MKKLDEFFGINVWNDVEMEKSISQQTYAKYKESLKSDKNIDLDTADEIASAMKDWAIGKGATHYTHWFFPMTGQTAEKHESFISTSNGKPILEFAGKELIKGEPDASSFPSGGLRETFEGRGYTVWDPTSYVFVKDSCLYIPTAFCSYTGETLDKKTPLLRSMDALNKECKRVLKFFGKDVEFVKPTVGVEQEYFLAPKEMFERREDLVLTGKTLFGAKPPKCQDLDDHYFGTINLKVKSFMDELDEELYQLGIYAKTEHKEVAPLQYELACMYEYANISLDHNQLVMEIMQRVAKEHGLVCIFHEKPFDYVNGSGKHNNWSLATSTGENLLAPGEDMANNKQFLLFVSAVMKAVDEYQDLLRISVASCSNDHRLGGNEAPPSIISVFLGSDITNVFEALENDKKIDGKNLNKMKLGVDAISEFTIDNTDRNRTSSFAFTGNKFEFRMLGSSQSIAEANIVLNTIVTKELKEFADELDKANDVEKAIHNIIKNTYKNHKRIVFNGNGYDKTWKEEAIKRGLLNLETTTDALSHMLDEKNIKLFQEFNVLNKKEYESRYEILLEAYIKNKRIEALTMIDMAKTMFLPTISDNISNLVDKVKNNVRYASVSYESDVLSILSNEKDKAYKLIKDIEGILNDDVNSYEQLGVVYKNELIPLMNSLRIAIDNCERVSSDKEWPCPRYLELLFKYRNN